LEQDVATPIQSQERLKAFTLREIKDEIKILNQKKAPGLDLITARMLKELPKEGLANLLYIFNAILRLEYWPKSKNITQIITLPKPGKNPVDVSSCRTISLLPTISKVLEKLILKKINKGLNPQAWIPQPSIWIPTSSLHSATMPPHNRRHQYSFGKPTILYSRIFRRKPGIRYSMAPRATIQNQKNFTLELFRPAEIVHK
jgi:hypothetical protein